MAWRGGNRRFRRHNATHHCAPYAEVTLLTRLGISLRGQVYQIIVIAIWYSQVRSPWKLLYVNAVLPANKSVTITEQLHDQR